MLSIPADAAASTRQPLEVSVLILSQWNLAQTVHKPGWLVSQGSDQLNQQFSSALASIAGQEVIWGPFIKHGLFCKMRFSDLEPVVQWCWLMTSLYILLCRIWPVWTPKWWILTDIPPSAASMVYTWHSVGLEVRVSDALWALCFTECDNEWAAARRPPSFAPHYSGDCVWFVVSVQLGSLQSGPKSVSAPKISKTLHLVCQHFLWRRKSRHVNNLLFSAIVVKNEKRFVYMLVSKIKKIYIYKNSNPLLEMLMMVNKASCFE